ncbi:MAG: DUF1360 domain-containing protein [Rickettsiales bacterium]|nr:DUF1360 domain-containing protein [Pseudomonadota bacterium]MDA0967311.1 DUF1360 domain-containing protein [Pseudomonadota bacterium]MDG4544028.1 DUF1360 domain-containing protein [Rickettsiales bacterium]MDG4546278.1 DUF1360 domain-containing protein [Rickettsiales bacterium]MDG4548352.1 DUF1360 domain-containing protein [Rickettsiales bacterium]
MHENNLSVEFLFIICVLAVWRVAHFFVAEDGPWDIVVKLRIKAGEGIIGQLMDCFYCMSVWVSVPFAFIMTNQLRYWFIYLLALSGAAALLEQLAAKNQIQDDK